MERKTLIAKEPTTMKTTNQPALRNTAEQAAWELENQWMARALVDQDAR